MTIPEALSVLLLLLGSVWAVLLTARAREWRSRSLATLVGLTCLAHLFPLIAGIDSWRLLAGNGVSGLSTLGYGAVALLTVAFLDRVLSRHSLLEGRLGKKEAYLESLFEGSAEAIALLDGGGRVLQANRAFAGMFGYAPSELPDRLIDELIVPEDRREEARSLRLRIHGGEKVSVETIRRRRDGTTVHVSTLGAPIRLTDGTPAVFTIYRDISQQVEVEGAFLKFETALATMQLGVTITDLGGRIVFTNPADAEMHGYQVEELIGRDVRIFAPDGWGAPMSTEEMDRITRWSREATNIRKNGEAFPVRLCSDVVRDRQGRPIGIVTTCEDITERRRAELALQESEERYALAVRGAKDGLFDWNLETDEVYYSGRWKAMLGYGDAEFGTSPAAWLDRVHPDDVARIEAELSSHRQGGSDHFECEHRIQHRDGHYIWALARGIVERNPSGRPYRIVGAMTDVTERKGLEEQLAKDALYDRLTGLPNRAFLTDQMERAFLQVKRNPDHRFGVLFLDLDRFKVVNDSMGHAAGDQLLIEVSRRIMQSIRPVDVATRLGGDEFLVLLGQINEDSDTTRVARRILEALEEGVLLEGREVFTSASIGIAVHEAGLEGPEHLLRHADTALYRAKSRGKGRFEVFDHEMHERAMALLQMEHDLRVAVEANQFRLLYQPVVRLQDETIASFEALLRWNHPDRGPVPTREFLPLAEETGLIVPIGYWVLEEACRQMADWVRQFPQLSDLAVSVNLSPKQLRQPDLVSRVDEAVGGVGLPPSRLRLEISEQTLMDDRERNIDLIERLRDLGVQVQIDDFGTGTSSLGYLHRFSVDTLKIDRSFVSQMGTPGDREGLIQAIIALARDMGISVVAEGVETPDQSAKLLDLECERGQGYLFSHPLEADAATDFLVDHLKAEE